MCTTTNDQRTHISTECAVGGSGQCDGTCVDHGNECTCSCHGAFDLPDTVEAVRDWHDEMESVVASFEEGDETERWSEASNALETLTEQNPTKSYRILAGQHRTRTVIAERY